MEQQKQIQEVPRWLVAVALFALVFVFYPGHLLNLGAGTDCHGDVELHRAIVSHVTSCYAEGRWNETMAVPWMAPYENTLVMTETFLFPAVAMAPFFRAFENRVAIHDLVTFLGWLLSVLAAYLLARKLRLSRVAALAAVLIVSANPMRLLYMNAFYIQVIFAFLFGLYFLMAYGRTGRTSALAASLAMMLVPAFSSGYLFPIGSIVFLIFFIWTALKKGLWRRKSFWAVGLFFLLVFFLTYLPYVFLVQETLAKFYDPHRLKPLTWLLLLNAFGSNPVHLFLPAQIEAGARPDNHAYLGIVAVVLAGFALVPMFRPSSSPLPPAGNAIRILRRWSIGLSIAGLPIAWLVWNAFWTPVRNPRIDELHALAAGFVVWPLVFRLLVTDVARRFYRLRWDNRFPFMLLILVVFLLISGSYFSVYRDPSHHLVRAVLVNPIGFVFARLPGVSMMRSIPRTVVFLFVGLAMLSGMGLDEIQRRVRRPRLVGLAVLGLLLLDLTPPFAFRDWTKNRQPPQAPAAYQFLAEQPRGAIFAEVPMPDYSAPAKCGGRQIWAIFGTIHHGQRLLTGYSGHDTSHARAYSDLFAARRFDEFYAAVEAGGVTYLVVRKDLPQIPFPEAASPPAPWKLVFEQGDEMVFEHPRPRLQMLGTNVFDRLRFSLPERPGAERELLAYLAPPAPAWFLTNDPVDLQLQWTFTATKGKVFRKEKRSYLKASLYSRDSVFRVAPPFPESVLDVGGQLRVAVPGLGLSAEFTLPPAPNQATKIK
jgi:hypothetical protein